MAKAVTQHHTAGDDGTKRSYESFPFGESMCIHYTPDKLIPETDAWLKLVKTNRMTCSAPWRSAREYIHRLFSIHCGRMGKPYWINKTPGLLNQLYALSTLYPDATCIHVIRDGRDVAASNLSLQWGPGDA